MKLDNINMGLFKNNHLVLKGFGKNKIVNYSLDDLKNACKLEANRMEGINNWIKANPGTDPNVYEMLDCMISCGQLSTLFAIYYEENGYPWSDKLGKKLDHHDLHKGVPELKEVFDQYAEMYRLRSSSELLKDEKLKKIMGDVSYLSYESCFPINKDAREEENIAEVIKKSASIYFYILQQKRDNPDFLYDNTKEFDKLKADYKNYNAYPTVIENGNHKYSGPILGDDIENLILGIEENYKYSNLNENVDIKSGGLHR